MPVPQTKGARGNFAERTIQAHRLGAVIRTERCALGASMAPRAPLNSIGLPDASRWAQIVRCQWSSLGMTRIPARVTVQYLRDHNKKIVFLVPLNIEQYDIFKKSYGNTFFKTSVVLSNKIIILSF